jgi:hypothetical protein
LSLKKGDTVVIGYRGTAPSKAGDLVADYHKNFCNCLPLQKIKYSINKLFPEGAETPADQTTGNGPPSTPGKVAYTPARSSPSQDSAPTSHSASPPLRFGFGESSFSSGCPGTFSRGVSSHFLI